MFLMVCSAEAQKLSYDSYIQRVKDNNVGYIAEKYNIDIAKANVQAAKVFNDPEIGFTYSNNQDKKMQMGQSYEGELGYTLPLANVRGARIGVASAEKDLTEASLADYFRNLKADAALEYAKALLCKKNMEVQYSSYEQMSQLAASDSVRHALGEISESDAMQSRLESKTMYNDYLQSETDYRNALIQLGCMMGDTCSESISGLTDSLAFSPQAYSLPMLLSKAEANRADLQMAVLTKTLSERNLRLIRANRATELGLTMGFAHNTIVRNEIAPAPAYNSLSVGVSIPLRLSNLNKGEVRAARYAVKQNEATLSAVKLQIASEVRQAYNSYVAAELMARRFSGTMISDAQTILKNKIFGYKQGETGLLEVLDAQRTYNEVLLSFYDTLFRAMTAQIELDRAVGI